MSEQLPPKKDIAARLLAQGYLQAEVARDKKVDVTKQTMTTWMKDPNFVKKVEEYKTDVVKHAEEIFSRHVGDAAEAIVEIATGGKLKDEEGKALDTRLISSRLKAALFIIERTIGKKTATSKNKLTNREEEPEEIDDSDIDDVLEFVD